MTIQNKLNKTLRMKSSIAQQIKAIAKLPLEERVNAINEIKIQLHEISPFATEPVDCVLWVKQNDVHANDYNPNSVAPPEMELLKVSILSDGYTQPIVAMPNENGQFEVIDGFHRNRCGDGKRVVFQKNCFTPSLEGA